MATDEFEPFRGLPITREQDTEIRGHIATNSLVTSHGTHLDLATC
jgi:hypothetical protein